MGKFSLMLVGGFMMSIGLTFAADAVPAAGGNNIAALYASKCASCHAKDGKGNPAMAKVFKLDPAALSLVSEAVAKKEDKELTAVTTNGHAKMPAYKGKISEADIAGLTAYIRTLAPKTEK